MHRSLAFFEMLVHVTVCNSVQARYLFVQLLNFLPGMHSSMLQQFRVPAHLRLCQSSSNRAVKQQKHFVMSCPHSGTHTHTHKVDPYFPPTNHRSSSTGRQQTALVLGEVGVVPHSEFSEQFRWLMPFCIRIDEMGQILQFSPGFAFCCCHCPLELYKEKSLNQTIRYK